MLVNSGFGTPWPSLGLCRPPAGLRIRPPIPLSATLQAPWMLLMTSRAWCSRTESCSWWKLFTNTTSWNCNICCLSQRKSYGTYKMSFLFYEWIGSVLKHHFTGKGNGMVAIITRLSMPGSWCNKEPCHVGILPIVTDEEAEASGSQASLQ